MSVEATETTQAAETVELTFEFTDAAAAKALSILKAEGREDWFLRIQVTPGGCAGFQYLPFVLTPELRDDDLIKDFDGVEVVVDGMTAPYITGATFDFVDTFQKRSFEIDNPNSQGSCACGSSFS
jgi:iron-sulfur cluster assembly accessory protein